MKWGDQLNVLRLAGISFVLAGHLLYPGQGRADSWQNAFSSRVAAEYDTNPAMSPAYPGGVWRGIFEPNYELIGKVGENDIKAGFGLQVVRSTNSALDPHRDSPAAHLEWLHHSDEGEIGISSRYAEIATRESGIDATGRVPANSTRASRTLSGVWGNTLSERSTLSADGSYEAVSYDGGNYVDYSMRSGGLKLSYALSDMVTSFGRLSGIRYMPADDGLSTSLADATLGLDWRTKNTNWTLQAGEAKVDEVKAIPEGLVATRFTGLRTQLSLNAGRSVLPSGLGGFVKADLARASWSYALSEYDNAGIDLEWRRNFPITVSTDRTVSTTAGAWMDHDLTPLWKMRMYFRHWINEVNGSDNVTTNIFGLSFAYSSANIQPNPDIRP